MKSDLIDRFAELWRTGDRAAAGEAAREYVDAFPELSKFLGHRSIPEIVELAEAYRAAGDERSVTILDMWITARGLQQRVVGQLNIGSDQLAAALAEHR